MVNAKRLSSVVDFQSLVLSHESHQTITPGLWERFVGILRSADTKEWERDKKQSDVSLKADVHFISYPKSGRSWVRYILRNLDADNGIAFHHDGFEFNDGSRPAHSFEIETRIALYSGKRIVYLRRDPRDVMVSLFFQVTGRFQTKFRYRGSISDFIRDPYFGAAPLCRFSLIWNKIAGELPVFPLSYEGMQADTFGQTQRLLAYLGINRPPESVERAVAAASIDNMREIERSGKFSEPWLRLRDGHPKVREGKVGGYRSALSPTDIAYLDHTFRELL
jgi:hypothetical protein